MIGEMFVIDAVVHGYNLTPDNQRVPAAAELAAALYYGVHRGFSPRGEEQWILDAQRFFLVTTLTCWPMRCLRKARRMWGSIMVYQGMACSSTGVHPSGWARRFASGILDGCCCTDR